MVVILQAIMVVIFVIALPLTVASALLELHYGKKFGSLRVFFYSTTLSAITIVILQLIKLYQ